MLLALGIPSEAGTLGSSGGALPSTSIADVPGALERDKPFEGSSGMELATEFSAIDAGTSTVEWATAAAGNKAADETASFRLASQARFVKSAGGSPALLRPSVGPGSGLLGG